jgi:hypothetical protein
LPVVVLVLPTTLLLFVEVIYLFLAGLDEEVKFLTALVRLPTPVFFTVVVVWVL